MSQAAFRDFWLRRRWKARHFVMFRVTSEKGRENIDVLRILHDTLDLQRHAPFDED